ncbi:hypothetical protein ACTQ45_04555 [Fundicoccus sp. Sow4_D5]|uniref:hypothetical protein n=1 Tax=unclassified Fundicoccus TaxID=2761543 RepID=UPI003F8DC40C
MRKIRTIFTALLLASVIVLAVSKQETNSWQLPEDILAKERNNQNHETQSHQGFPEEIEGVWEVTKSDGTAQTLTLYGSQLSVHTQETGSVYYDNIVTQIQQDSPLMANPNATKSYALVWDINAFIERYGENNLPDNQAPFTLAYDEQNDQLSTSSTLIYKRNKEAELVQQLKTQLVEQLPINRLQLAAINSQILLDLWEAAQLNELENEALSLYLYKGLQAHYPELSLLAQADIKDYQALVEELMKRNGLTYEEINQAGPAKLWATYERLRKETLAEGASNEVNIETQLPVIMEALQVELTSLRADYQQAVIEREKQEAIIISQ